MPKESIAELRKKIALLKKELRATREERDFLKKIAMKDALTGLHSRWFMNEEVPRMITHALRKQYLSGIKYSVCICALDADYFKQINDTYGHAGGDEAIKAIANALKISTRSEDLVVRLGGDEFIVFWISPESCADQPLQRIEDAIAEIKLEYAGREIRVSITTGFYCLPAEEENVFEKLLRKADAIMYANKKYKD